MQKCKFCGSNIPDEDTFCRYCGNRVKPKPSPYRTANSPKSEYQDRKSKNSFTVDFIKWTAAIMLAIIFLTIVMITIGFFVDESTVDNLNNVIELMTKLGTFIGQSITSSFFDY